jgi:hypothetical protein
MTMCEQGIYVVVRKNEDGTESLFQGDAFTPSDYIFGYLNREAAEKVAKSPFISEEERKRRTVRVAKLAA